MTEHHSAGPQACGLPRDEPAQAWSARRPERAALIYIACYLAVAAIGGASAGFIRPAALAGIVVTLLGGTVLLISLLLVLSLCRLSIKPRREAAWVVAMLVLFSLVRPSVYTFLGKLVGLSAGGAHIAKELSAVVPPAADLVLGNTVLIVWAAFLGRLVSRIIREGKLILPVAVVASIADVITVFWGVVAHVSKTAPEVVETFSASAPVVPPPNVAAPILSAVGIGDFLFLAVFLSVTTRYGMRPAATMWATFAMMLIAPIAFWISPGLTGMPGLPFLSAAALWANRRHIHFTAEEKRALAVGGIVVVVMSAAVWTLFHR